MIIIYLAGVIAGSLMTSITDPNVYLAGASGGVYSLITAHIASVIMVKSCLLLLWHEIILNQFIDFRIGKKCLFRFFN